MIRNLAFVAPFVIAGQLFAEMPIMSAPEAFSAVRNDDMVISDIRSPGEWDQTGVAQGAVALTMHNPDFPNKIRS